LWAMSALRSAPSEDMMTFISCLERSAPQVKRSSNVVIALNFASAKRAYFPSQEVGFLFLAPYDLRVAPDGIQEVWLRKIVRSSSKEKSSEF
jgi:hypothetical protein